MSLAMKLSSTVRNFNSTGWLIFSFQFSISCGCLLSSTPLIHANTKHSLLFILPPYRTFIMVAISSSTLFIVAIGLFFKDVSAASAALPITLPKSCPADKSLCCQEVVACNHPLIKGFSELDSIKLPTSLLTSKLKCAVTCARKSNSLFPSFTHFPSSSPFPFETDIKDMNREQQSRCR